MNLHFRHDSKRIHWKVLHRLGACNLQVQIVSAIKKDILKETVDKKRHNALTKEVIPIEEKPNKPKDKYVVNTMNTNETNNSIEPLQVPLNLT